MKIEIVKMQEVNVIILNGKNIYLTVTIPKNEEIEITQTRRWNDESKDILRTSRRRREKIQ